jgi:tetratricopeptide (TPR) repeat protein
MAVVMAEGSPQHGGGHLEEKTGSISELIMNCNKDGMELLRKGEHQKAFEEFKYAEAILLGSSEPDTNALLAVTCNNLGCYFKKTGKYHGALSYLRRALKMEVELKTDDVTLAGTHLNLCAVLSKLEKHDKAVQHAVCALDLMSRVISSSTSVCSQDDYAVLAIAYHNVAVEREMLEQWDQAATASIDGFQVAKRLMGENHPLTMTLGRNCQAVLKKAQAKKQNVPRMRALADKGGRASSSASSSESVTDGELLPSITDQIRLPALNSKAKSSIRDEASEWLQHEQALWTSFAKKAMGTAEAEEDPYAMTLAHPEAEGMKVPPLTARRLQSLKDAPQVPQEAAPQLYDMGNLGIEGMLKRMPKQTPLAEAMDQFPEALMDIVDTDLNSQVSMKSTSNDLRPNRSMKRQTRTTRVIRKTGVYQTTDNRDRVAAELEKRRLQKVEVWRDPLVQKMAAQKIQRVWRSWYSYCQENAEWMTITWICATMIQSHWRSYHVRRVKMDRAASRINSIVLGFLARRVMKKHRASVNIQKRLKGILTRMRISHWHKCATTIQRHVRGHLGRRYATELREFKSDVAIIVQKHYRAYLARCRMDKVRSDKQFRDTLLKAAMDLQRMFRGWKGRKRFDERAEEARREDARWRATIKIQALARAVKARIRVKRMRQDQMEEMAKAVTFVRKVWLGRQARKRLAEVKQRLEANPDDVITIQRYMRGCMVRVKLWREAVQTEESLWAAIEIQRLWRGYAGRVKWELTYEDEWRREMAAAMIQRNVRMGLARLKVRRMQHAISRGEFEKARDRFRAAVKIQALARGVAERERFRPRFFRCVTAAVAIQRIHRGVSTRQKIWNLVVEQKASTIAAYTRGWLIRKRMADFKDKVVRIQRAFRRHRLVPQDERDRRRRLSVHRRKQASKIGMFWRSYAATKRYNKARSSASDASTASA